MPKKYPNATPQDVPEPSGAEASKGYKPEQLGSGIRVDGKPLDALEKRLKEAESDRARDDSKGAAALKAAGAMMGGMRKPEEKAKGGMTASSRADGCCTKGKTRGKMM